MATSKAVKKKEAQEVVSVPDYIKRGGNRGSENVTNDDLQLPRINVIQALSPQISKNKPEFIQGAEVGHLFNTLTGELYPDGVVFCPVTFQKRYFVWKTQDSGGGLRGIFDFNKQKEAELLTVELNEGSSKDEEYECVLTHEHLVLMQDGTEVILSCAKSKTKASKKFNSMVRLNGDDRFSRQYKLTVVDDENEHGKEYKNFNISPALGAEAFPKKDVYLKAESLYGAIETEGTTYGGDYSDETETETQTDDSVVGEY